MEQEEGYTEPKLNPEPGDPEQAEFMSGDVSPHPPFSLPWIFLRFIAFTKSTFLFSCLSYSFTVKKKIVPNCQKQPWVVNRKQNEPQCGILGFLSPVRRLPPKHQLCLSLWLAKFHPGASCTLCHSRDQWAVLLQMIHEYHSITNQFHK